jgi:hypothetical protein
MDGSKSRFKDCLQQSKREKHGMYAPSALILERPTFIYIISFFYVGPPKESIFLTTFYDLYFSHQFLHMLQITILFS